MVTTDEYQVAYVSIADLTKFEEKKIPDIKSLEAQKTNGYSVTTYSSGLKPGGIYEEDVNSAEAELEDYRRRQLDQVSSSRPPSNNYQRDLRSISSDAVTMSQSIVEDRLEPTANPFSCSPFDIEPYQPFSNLKDSHPYEVDPPVNNCDSANGYSQCFIPNNDDWESDDAVPDAPRDTIAQWWEQQDGLSYVEKKKALRRKQAVDRAYRTALFQTAARHASSAMVRVPSPLAVGVTSRAQINIGADRTRSFAPAATHNIMDPRSPYGKLPPTNHEKIRRRRKVNASPARKNSAKASPTRGESPIKRSTGLLHVLADSWLLTATLIFIPFGYTSYYLQWKDYWTFGLNFMGIIPLAWLIGQSTEDLAAQFGQIIGGLVNAWFGNVVEMLLIISALRHGQIIVVRATLIGSILSNILLVAGCSFLFGGMKHKVQHFSEMGARVSSTLLYLTILCLGLPTLYNVILDKAEDDLLNISRSVSFMLVVMYSLYMAFQLVTHPDHFQDGEDDDEPQKMNAIESVITLGVCTVLCSFGSEFLITSIDGTVSSSRLSKEFIGIILLPIIGNAAEHYTAVVVAIKNKMDLSISCAIGSSVQMSLFVTPFSVLCAWAIGQPMTLDLHPYELLVLIASVLIVTSILTRGMSTWLDGSILCVAYFIIATIYLVEDPKYSDIL